jgi:hypothetical protein
VSEPALVAGLVGTYVGLVRARDAEEVALRRLDEQREATRAVGVGSRHFVERFHSADVVAARFEAIYEEVLARR